MWLLALSTLASAQPSDAPVPLRPEVDDDAEATAGVCADAPRQAEARRHLAAARAWTACGVAWAKAHAWARVPAAERAARAEERARGWPFLDHERLRATAWLEGRALLELGRGAEAVDLLRPVLPRGADEVRFGGVLVTYARALIAAGRAKEAIPVLTTVVTRSAVAMTAEDARYFRGQAEMTAGDLGAAEADARAVVDAADRGSPVDPARAALTRELLASVLLAAARPAEALAAAQEAERIETEAHLSPLVALDRQMHALIGVGRVDDAAAVAERAGATAEVAYGPRAPLVATIHNNIGHAWANAGQWARAADEYERAAMLLDGHPDADPAALARMQHNAAAAQVHLANPSAAKIWARLAFETGRRAWPGGSVELAEVQGLLAEAERLQWDVDAALDDARAAHAAAARLLGEDAPETLRLRVIEAAVLATREEHPAAVAALKPVLAAFARNGTADADLVAPLVTLATELSVVGDDEGALALLDRAVAATTARFGPGYPELADLEADRAVDLARLGRLEPALDAVDVVQTLRDRLSREQLPLLDPHDARLFLDMQSVRNGALVSVVMRAHTARGDRLAADLVLQSKGRGVNAEAALARRIRRFAAPSVGDKLLRARAALADAVLTGGSMDLIAQAEGDRRQIETDAARGLGLEPLAPAPTWREVASSLPDGVVLIEYLRAVPAALDGRPSASVVTAIYTGVMLRAGAAPVVVDLGDAASLDAAIRAYLLAAEGRANAAPLAAVLAARLVEPFDLTGASHVLFSPDGAVNLVPFAALIDDDGRYLDERFDTSILTAGADLLRARVAPRSGPPVVVAGPDYGPGSRWPALPGAAREGSWVASRLPGATRLSGAAATADAFLGLTSPRILHVATHGFTSASGASPGGRGGADPARSVPVGVTPAAAVDALASIDPLARSGLVLADGNAGGGRGVVTAGAIAGMDLSGTKLVVMSACDSGLGTLSAGDGVAGLRLGFSVAGAGSVVYSLWKVDDEATAALMREFYGELARGAGRATALRKARATIRSVPRWRAPAYWAAFSLAGDWGPL